MARSASRHRRGALRSLRSRVPRGNYGLLRDALGDAGLLTFPLRAGAIRRAIQQLAAAHPLHTDLGAAARFWLCREAASLARFIRRNEFMNP